jgi:hypothetical protein
MSNTYLNILIGLSATIIGFLAFADQIGEVNALKFFKLVAFKLIVFFIAMFLGIWSTIKKDNNSSLEIAKEKSIALKEQSRRDSLNRQYTNENNRNLLTTFTNALAQYGLKYDAANKAILKSVSDSLSSIPDPELILDYSDGIKLDSIKDNICFFRVTLCDRIAPSNNIKLKIYFATERNDGYHIVIDPLHNNDAFPIGESLATNSYSYFNVDLRFNNMKNLYCHLIGTYTNLRNTKTYKIDTIFSYDMNSNKFSKPRSPVYESVRDFFKGNNS